MADRDEPKQSRINNVVRLMKATELSEPKPAKEEPRRSTKRKKKSAVEQVAGRKQELVAKTIISCETALDKVVDALNDKDNPPKFRDGAAAVSALARLAQTLADLTLVYDDRPDGLADTAAIRERVLTAYRKLSG